MKQRNETGYDRENRLEPHISPEKAGVSKTDSDRSPAAHHPLDVKLARAVTNANQALHLLCTSALDYARRGAPAMEGLVAAAKKHTNAEHQASRCRKHVREWKP